MGVVSFYDPGFLVDPWRPPRNITPPRHYSYSHRVGYSVLRYLGSPSPTRKTLQRCFVAGTRSLSGFPHRSETAIDGQLYGLRKLASYTSCYLPHVVVRIDHWKCLLRILITKTQDLSHFRFPLLRNFVFHSQLSAEHTLHPSHPRLSSEGPPLLSACADDLLIGGMLPHLTCERCLSPYCHTDCARQPAHPGTATYNVVCGSQWLVDDAVTYCNPCGDVRCARVTSPPPPALYGPILETT
jgi:hypothetical protein